MEIATCWLTQDKFGSNVPLFGVTPPELVHLVTTRKHLLGRFPITDLKVVRDDKRDDKSERERLRKYGIRKDREGNVSYNVDNIYPPHTSKYPQTFKETGMLDEAAVIRVTGDIVVAMPDESGLPPIVESETYWKDKEFEKLQARQAADKEALSLKEKESTTALLARLEALEAKLKATESKAK